MLCLRLFSMSGLDVSQGSSRFRANVFVMLKHTDGRFLAFYIALPGDKDLFVTSGQTYGRARLDERGQAEHVTVA